MRKEFLPLARPHITKDEIEKVTEVLQSGWWTTGPKVTEFEKAFSDYIGEKTGAVSLSSCTAGLYLGLLAYGIGPGDEVIVPTWTFAATAHVVGWTGAKPVLCDIEGDSLNIDVEEAEKLITPATKAIMPVHIAGFPCNQDAIASLARRYNLIIIEDAAHAAGTKYNGKKIGLFGDMAVFSFYATKNLATGEGGMVVSKHSEIIEKIRKLSYFGINKKAFERYSKFGTWYYEIEENGYKFNFDSIHAALGLVQLAKLDKMNARRREIADIYKKNLDPRIRYTRDDPTHFHNYHLFPILVDPELIQRDVLIEELKKRNIGTGVHFIPLHIHPYYRKQCAGRKFPKADEFFKRILSLPMFPGMSDKDVSDVYNTVNEILGGL